MQLHCKNIGSLFLYVVYIKILYLNGWAIAHYSSDHKSLISIYVAVLNA